MSWEINCTSCESLVKQTNERLKMHAVEPEQILTSSSTSENSTSHQPSKLITHFRDATAKRYETFYIKSLDGYVRMRSLDGGDMAKLATFPANMQSYAGLALAVVDEHNDATHVCDDDGIAYMMEVDAKVLDELVGKFNQFCLAGTDVAEQEKN